MTTYAVSKGISALAAKKKAGAAIAAKGAATLTGKTVLTTGLTSYLQTHAALVTSITGVTLFGTLTTMLAGIAVSLCKLVQSNIKSKNWARENMDGAKILSAIDRDRLERRLDDMCDEFGL